MSQRKTHAARAYPIGRTVALCGNLGGTLVTRERGLVTCSQCKRFNLSFMDAETEMSEKRNEEMKPSGMKGWSFYPEDVDGLHDRIRESAQFNNIGEASAFAHSAVIVMKEQQRLIVQLQQRLDRLESLNSLKLWD